MIEQVKTVIANGLKKMAEQNNAELKNVQMGFGLNVKNQLHCLQYINNQVSVVTLNDLIGSHFYNFAVKAHIERKLLHLAHQNKVAVTNITLRAIADPAVKVFLYTDGQKIREVPAEELT